MVQAMALETTYLVAGEEPHISSNQTKPQRHKRIGREKNNKKKKGDIVGAPIFLKA